VLKAEVSILAGSMDRVFRSSKKQAFMRIIQAHKSQMLCDQGNRLAFLASEKLILAIKEKGTKSQKLLEEANL